MASGWCWDQKEDQRDPEMLTIKTEIKGVTVRILRSAQVNVIPGLPLISIVTWEKPR